MSTLENNQNTQRLYFHAHTRAEATNNSRITLMHILVAQVAAFSDALPRTLLEELAATRAAAKLTIAPFAESVAAFHREASHASACSQTRGVGCCVFLGGRPRASVSRVLSSDVVLSAVCILQLAAGRRREQPLWGCFSVVLRRLD